MLCASRVYGSLDRASQTIRTCNRSCSFAAPSVHFFFLLKLMGDVIGHDDSNTFSKSSTYICSVHLSVRPHHFPHTTARDRSVHGRDVRRRTKHEDTKRPLEAGSGSSSWSRSLHRGAAGLRERCARIALKPTVASVKQRKSPATLDKDTLTPRLLVSTRWCQRATCSSSRPWTCSRRADEVCR